MNINSTAKNGYSWHETLWYHSDFNHDGWDIAHDENQRFVHLNSPQFFPHAWIHRKGYVSELEVAPRPKIHKTKATTVTGKMTLDEWLANTSVDGYLVIHKGIVIFEAYPRMRPFDKHHWWSTSKCVTGTLVAMLEEEGKVDVSQPVETYIPRLKGTAWAGVPVIDVLDMASGTAGLEADDPNAYTDHNSLYNRYEASIGNRPKTPMTLESTYEYVALLPRHRTNGEAYEYTSVNTFVCAWLVETITGNPLAEVISERIWQKMGAESDALIMMSRFGAPHNSSINSTLRDLGRYGMLFTPSWGVVAKEQVISDAYLKKIQTGGRPEIFAKAAAGEAMNQFFEGERPRHNTYQWDLVMEDGDFLKAGHSGQGVYISPSRDVVVAFFGTGDNSTIACSAAFARAIAKSLD
jgi:CubicO group peptidase (beta-lactamase class C family)